MEKTFGKLADGREARLYTISCGRIVSEITNYGASLVSLTVDGVDVCLGCDDVSGYERNGAYLGAVVGRNANRMSGASFLLNGEKVQLPANEGNNNLHSGPESWGWRLWEVKSHTENSLTLGIFSPDGDQGFPGNAEVSVTYTVDAGGLTIAYRAVSDRDTVFNLTNHAYFNLNGGGSILEHTLQVDSEAYTAQDEHGLSTGELVPVAGTVYDFREPRKIGEGIGDAAEGKLRFYDLNFCLKGEGLRKVAELKGEFLTMETLTTTPGVQFYAAGFGKPHPAKVEGGYTGYCFACLETQGYPNSTHIKSFPSDIVKAGETYRQTTVYRFK